MSIQFIIDGYNITNHPKFAKSASKKVSDSRSALIQLIRFKGLCGSRNNRVTIVFDGYPDQSWDFSDTGNINIVFSRRQDADSRIKKMVELFANAKNIVVVSDDKEIKLFVKSYGAKSMSVEEFLGVEEKGLKGGRDLEAEEGITYSQMHKINEELRRLWLS